MRKTLAILAVSSMFILPTAAMAAEGAAGPQELADGARVYAESCASCHGVNLEGQANWRQLNENGRLPAPPHNARGHTWHHDDATLFGITKLGTAEFTGLDIASDMPAFKDILSDDEIRAVLAYIKSRWPARIRRQQESINRRAENR
ncbi:MAG: c-type cytochrome [Alphaproteobacteria bacterium]|nr:c-type cytochrome [Alphaproteobacteria bacterium]